MFGGSDLGLQRLPKHLRSLETSFSSGLIFCNAFSKRNLGADLKPFSNIVSLRTVFSNVTKSVLVPAVLMMNEYNFFMMEHDDDEQEFDFDDAMKRHSKVVPENFIKFSCVGLMTKLMEQAAEWYLSAKWVDRLSKDVGKSMLRKIHKYDRRTACCRIFFTSIRSKTLFSISQFFTYTAFDLFTDVRKADMRPSIINFILSKLAAHLSAMVVSSALYSIGAYFGDLTIVAPMCSLLGEAIGGEIPRLLLL